MEQRTNMKFIKIVQRSILAVTIWALPMFAQDSSSVQMTSGPQVDATRKSSDAPRYPDSQPPKTETTVGGYETKQVIEFGGRITNFTGNQGTWDTFVNLGSGPRLLEYTLDMHSPTHTGYLFDDLNFSNFGYGGDPYDVSRLHIAKGTLYNFNASFRRDQNIFDYDLLANPLNPVVSTPSIQINDSPHEFLMTRRMSDVDLSLFTKSAVRVKLGWNRVVNEGSTFSSIHEGTDSLLFQPTLNTSDTFHGGVSLHFIPRTNINFDQYYTFYKGDTTATLAGTGFNLAGGIPVDLGLPFNTPAGQPCAAPLLASGLANPTCNGALSYSRSGRNRNDYPTEQLSFQTEYFRKLDMSGRFSYTDAEANLPDFNETFNGLISRTAQRIATQTGSASAKRISRDVDFGMTYHITSKLRLVDSFRLDNFSIPTGWNYLTNSLFGPNLLSTPKIAAHTNSSGPDVIQDVLNQFIRQDRKVNTFQVEYDFTKRVSAYLGYRFERREITDNDADVQIQTFLPNLPNRGACAGQPLVNGACTITVADSGNSFVPINANSAVFGVSARPTNQFRVSFDSELYYADNVFTRIAPRHMQFYRARSTYKPRPWMSLGGTVSIREGRNNTDDILVALANVPTAVGPANLQHTRSYAISAVIAPPEAKWGLDLSYDYSDIFSQSTICIVSTPAVSGFQSTTCGTSTSVGQSVYNEKANYVAGSVYIKPISRVTAALGYTVTSTNGTALIINPNTPTGPQAYNYHLPTANLIVQLSKGLAYKTGWNFYDYNEKSAAGPTLPRDFRGNAFTMSLRYTM